MCREPSAPLLKRVLRGSGGGGPECGWPPAEWDVGSSAVRCGSAGGAPAQPSGCSWHSMGAVLSWEETQALLCAAVAVGYLQGTVGVTQSPGSAHTPQQSAVICGLQLHSLLSIPALLEHYTHCLAVGSCGQCSALFLCWKEVFLPASVCRAAV